MGMPQYQTSRSSLTNDSAWRPNHGSWRLGSVRIHTHGYLCPDPGVVVGLAGILLL